MIQLAHQESKFQEKKFPIILVLDSITGPPNVGSLFRLADSFNIEKVVLCGATFTQIDSNRVRRTARSTTNTMICEYYEDSLEACRKFSSDGYTILALEITTDSQPVETMEYDQYEKLVLIIGNEQSGIAEELLLFSDKRIHVSMFGKNSSMNVSHAAGIALFEITKTLQPF